jgi:hypothetical protein
MVLNSQTIGSLLHSLRDLEAILVRVKQLARLQQAYSASVPRELARRSRVAYEREGTVVVSADTSAIAAKLRQLAPRIVIGIVKSCPEVTAIQIELQVTEAGQAAPEPRPEIGSQGLASFGQLRDSLPASPLREALDRLVARRLALDGEDQSLKREEGQRD